MKNLSPIDENRDVVTKEYVDPIKSQAAINRTTLGTQCKNLHDTLSVNWYQPGKTSVASDGTVTTTITSDSRSFTYANSEHYITLEAGNYIITANTLEFAAGSSALIRGCNSDNRSLFALSVSSAGLHKAAFSLSKKTTIGIMYKLYSQTCTIMIRDADILDDTYEPYQPSLIDRCLLKDTAGINLGHAQSDSITIDNLSAYTALWVNVSGGVSGINFTTNLIVPVAYLAKSTSNSVQLAGGIPSSAYITSEGVLAAKYMDGTITAKISGNTLELTIGKGTIGAIEVISLM